MYRTCIVLKLGGNHTTQIIKKKNYTQVNKPLDPMLSHSWDLIYLKQEQLTSTKELIIQLKSNSHHMISIYF
jgi:hypothetical protein